MQNTRLQSALKYFRENEEAEERIKNDIEQNRKGDFSVEFSDLPNGAKVSYKLKNHAFKFGANLFMLDQFDDEKLNEKYREIFPKTFNLATLPFYWKDQEPQRGKTRYTKDSEPIYRRPPIDACLEYCEEKGIEPKAHCLNYDYFRPEWLHGASIEEHKAALEARFSELAARYSGIIPSWEVLNEPFNDPYDLYSEFYASPDYASWSFMKAKEYFPNNHLILNDHVSLGCMMLPHGDIIPNRSAYYVMARDLLREGAKLDSIGFQYHSFFDREKEAEIAKYRYNPANLFRILDQYAMLGTKMQITEITLPAYSSSSEDEEVQAELLRATFRLFFSIKQMEAIIYWNLTNGGASGPHENKYFGGLMSADLVKKPAYEALEDLLREWHTEGVGEVKNGQLDFRGFYGDYEITVGDKEYSVSLTEASPKSKII